jgi:acyl carrier protein
MTHTHTGAIVKTLLLLCMLLAGCSEATQSTGDPGVDAVRAEVAKHLKKEPNQIDVAKPLAAFGADELDVVEIVLAVEQAFKVVIPDESLGEKPSQTLTVKQLAEIVSKQPKIK